MAPGSEDMSWGLGAPESGELAAMFMPWFIMFMLAAAGVLIPFMTFMLVMALIMPAMLAMPPAPMAADMLPGLMADCGGG